MRRVRILIYWIYFKFTCCSQAMPNEVFSLYEAYIESYLNLLIKAKNIFQTKNHLKRCLTFPFALF